MSWEKFGDTIEKGPYRAGCAIGGLLLFFGVALGCLGYVGGWFNEAGKVAQDELGPRALLKKYETFKDLSAAIDKSDADIKVYESRLKSIEDQYKGVQRKDWAREDIAQHSLAASELAGLKANRNRLAAEYNSQMAKENWKFANAGELPAGAKPLPREYREYTEK
jgi:hypothetical protein